MREVLTLPLGLLGVTITLGLALGKIRIGRFALGSSGVLFVGLFVGWWVVHSAEAAEQSRWLAEGLIGTDIFRLALVLFIGAVSLSSARYLGKVIQLYGWKLLLMGILVPLTGALASWGLARIIPGVIVDAVPGVFVGALTSSPGLAAALEHVASRGREVESAVGFGYAVGYIPGVLTVVLGMQIIPVLLKLDSAKENRNFCEDLDIEPEVKTSGSFRPLEFSLVIALGYLLGTVKFSLGSFSLISLGSTGGILIVGLILGFVGKLGPLDFRMPAASLAAVRELGIALFLASAGLRYGFRAANSLAGDGLPLLLLSLGTSLASIGVGFAFGHWVLRLNWILLAGALCGAMTSTPGLGASVDATGCEDVSIGYGAVYPVALLSMVIFTIFLSAV